ncbi:MAG: kynureninase [Alphaproteobacteria bacterium]|nr:kynureninase [Alphaproteobacteria bacterium]MBV9062010.1 kynureninase [Alphaproteobacteria bacterium]
MRTREDCLKLDADDPLGFARARFSMPEGLIYLDGNSLGALPVTTAARVEEVIAREWGGDLIRSWNTADWIGLPLRVAKRIAPLIGAGEDEVIAADSTSVNLFKLAAAALKHQAPRRVILTEGENFPTDQYVLQGLEALPGGAAELRTVAREELLDALNDDVALIALTHVDYKSGAIHDMAAITAAAHRVGALALWDLSHSAGAVELALNGCGADLAIGCGYKYLNGGPGAPAYLFVARHLQDKLVQPLSGWMGHAAPFEFASQYRPAAGMLRFLSGTPVVLGMAAFEEGLKTFDGISMREVQAKARVLGDLFLSLVESRCRDAGFVIGCPRDSAKRGSQVCLWHPEGYAIMQALIAEGVIGDFRAPDVMRFGFAPLYTRYVDVFEAVTKLAEIMRSGRWHEGCFQVRAAVT